MIVASFFAPRFDKWQCDYDRLLRLLDLSCKKLDLKHIVISDELRPGLDTFVCPLPENLMLALLEGQRQFLAQSTESVLFVGADCLLRDRLEIVKANMVITTSNSFSDCRFNSGAIWCGGKICEEIWAEALSLKPLDWGQDQIALYSVIKKSRLLIEEVACEEHNWAPNDVNDPCPSTVVHFRGRRKAWMEEWANRHMGLRL